MSRDSLRDAPSAPAGDFAETTCSAPVERSERMRDIVRAHVPADRAARLLDIGCGTGSLIFRLAEALPLATLVGIDLSAANIRAAIEQKAGGPSSPMGNLGRSARIAFEISDYLAYRAEPFDVIVADGVLHLIAGDTDVLVRKLSHDLKSGGLLVCDMPFDCAYNRLFAVVRRGLRAFRSPLLDRAIFHTARLLHRQDMDDARLRERVGYMYLPPHRMMGRRLAQAFAAAGLRPTDQYPMRNTSPSQLKHRVTVFARDAASG